jgi:hypothetical protein
VDKSQNKTPQTKSLERNERFANASEPPVVIPIVVVTVDVDLAIVVPPVERGKIV